MVFLVSVAEQCVGRTPTEHEVHQILVVMVSEIADSYLTHCTFQQFITAYQTLEVMVSEIAHLYMCHMSNPLSGCITHGMRKDLLVRRSEYSFLQQMFSRYLADSSEQTYTQIWLTLFYVPRNVVLFI